jgi:hypothetical protein
MNAGAIFCTVLKSRYDQINIQTSSGKMNSSSWDDASFFNDILQNRLQNNSERTKEKIFKDHGVRSLNYINRLYKQSLSTTSNMNRQLLRQKNDKNYQQ